MTTIRRSVERGKASFGWLDARYSFSFGHYHDPQHMGFGHLRVINEDRIEPGRGFDTHGHRDMEIVTYVLDGALAHKDSMGEESIIRPGDVQRMTAGTGVRHSEYNASDIDPVHLLQIWVLPERAGLQPGYEQRHFSAADKRDRLALVGSRDGRDGSVTIHQDTDLYASVLHAGEGVVHTLDADRQAWLQLIRGSVRLGNQELQAGDGVAIEGPANIALRGVTETEFLLFDMGRREHEPSRH